MPSVEEITVFQQLIVNLFPDINGVWCSMDGLKIIIHQAGNYYVQLGFYTGWLHDHFVGNTSVFAPSGICVAAWVNNPGSWHESKIADYRGIYDKLGRCSRENWR